MGNVFSGIANMVIGALGEGGSVPEVPQWQILDPAQVQKKAVQENIDVLPKAQQLATMVDAFNQTQVDKLLSAVLPGYRGLFRTGLENAAALMAGKLPQKDIDTAMDISNARNMGQGVGFGGVGNQFDLQRLGITQVQANQMGLQNFAQLLGMGQSVTPQQFDYSRMFVSPTQQYAMMADQQSRQWTRDWLSAQMQAMPDPNVQLMAEGAGTTLQSILSMGAGMAGGASSAMGAAGGASMGGAMGGFMGGGWGALAGAAGGMAMGANNPGAWSPYSSWGFAGK